MALAWLLTRPAVTGPIIGPRTLEQLDGALRALELRLEDKVLDRLDEIFPGYRDGAGALRLVDTVLSGASGGASPPCRPAPRAMPHGLVARAPSRGGCASARPRRR